MTALPFARPLLGLLLAGALAGCGGMGDKFGRDPETSGLVVDGTTIPEVARVSVPMPAAAMEAPRQGSDRASLFSRRQEALFSDQRADDVGDLLTVIISIDDEARLRNASDRSREGGGSVGFPSFFGYASQIAEVLPGVNRSDLPSDNIVDLSSATSASGSGSINRNEKINLKVAALVVQKLPNGALVVAGRQEVKVNQELRELRMAGIVRPQDIGNDNTIPYEKIAEARIAYGGRGMLSRTQERGYGEDAMDIILPY